MKKSDIMDNENGLFDGPRPGPQGLVGYFYSNQDNLRHYLSQDCLLPAIGMEMVMENYHESPSTIIDNALLFFLRKLNTGIVDKYSGRDRNIVPVILEITIPNDSSFSFVTNDGDGSLETLSYRDLDSRRPEAVLIPRPITFNNVSRILFRNESERTLFISQPFATLEIPNYLLFVDAAAFDGNLAFNDFNDIYDKFRSADLSFLPTRHHLFVRNRVRGALIAALSGYEGSIADGISINIDEKAINLFLRLTGVDAPSSSSWVLDNCNRINQLLQEKGSLVHLNSLKLPDDQTPFGALDSILRSLFEQVKSDNGTQNKSKEILSGSIDSYVFESTLKHIFESIGRDIDANVFVDNVRDSVSWMLDKSPYRDKREELHSSFDKIFDVLSNRRKIIDILPELRANNHNSLVALMIFISGYDFRKFRFGQLRDRLCKLPITPFEQRLFWVCYGLYNGVAPLGSEFKKDRDVLNLADIGADNLLSSRLSVSNSTPERKDTIFLHSLLESEKPFERSFEVVSRIGNIIPFRMSFKETSNTIRNVLLERIRSNQERVAFQEWLFAKGTVPQEYFTWKIQLKVPAVKLAMNLGWLDLEVNATEQPIFSRTWTEDGWNGFVRTYLESEEMFSRHFAAHIVDLRTALLRHDYSLSSKSIKKKKQMSTSKSRKPKTLKIQP